MTTSNAGLKTNKETNKQTREMVNLTNYMGQKNNIQSAVPVSSPTHKSNDNDIAMLARICLFGFKNFF